MNLFRNLNQIVLFTIFLIAAPSLSAKSSEISDSAITIEVKAKVVLEPYMSIFKVDVTTNHGIVMLSGAVDSEQQASSLVQLTQSIEGVKDVNTSKLVVRQSTHPLEDAYITSKVKGEFIKEKLFGDMDIAAISIKIETEKGIVHLSGTATNKKQAKNAVELAKSVKGVRGVKSEVTVVPAKKS